MCFSRLALLAVVLFWGCGKAPKVEPVSKMSVSEARDVLRSFAALHWQDLVAADSQGDESEKESARKQFVESGASGAELLLEIAEDSKRPPAEQLLAVRTLGSMVEAVPRGRFVDLVVWKLNDLSFAAKDESLRKEMTRVLKVALAAAIANDPAHAEYLILRGQLSTDDEQYDAAVADFNKAIELKPTLAAGFVNRGIAYQNKGEHEKVIADCSEAIALNPQSKLGYRVRALSFDATGKKDEAAADREMVEKLGSEK